MIYLRTKIIFALFFCTIVRAEPRGAVDSSNSVTFPVDSLPNNNFSGITVSQTENRLSTNDIIIGSAGTAAACALFFQYDQKTYDYFHDLKRNNGFIKDLGPKISYLGDGTLSLGLFSGFVGYGFAFHNKKAIEVGKIGLESFFLSGIAVQLFKQLCGRERPSASTRPGGFWHGPFGFFRQHSGESKSASSFDAFPSGHTATAFAAATTLSDFYDEPWVSYTSYSLAALCAVSRITESTHWLSDCFIGAIIGFYSTRLMEKITYGTTDVTIIPFVDSNRSGFQILVML
jgi:membrane-associated phospholipid phosphatase